MGYKFQCKRRRTKYSSDGFVYHRKKHYACNNTENPSHRLLKTKMRAFEKDKGDPKTPTPAQVSSKNNIYPNE